MEVSVHQITPAVQAHREDMAVVHCNNMLPAAVTVNTAVPWASHVISVLTHVHVSTLYVLTRACARWIPHAACMHREVMAAVPI